MRTSTRRGDDASALLSASNVRLLLTGHVHAPSITYRGDVENGYLSVSAGTLSKRLRKEPPSFNVITWGKTALRIQIFHFEDGAFRETRKVDWDHN